MLRLPTFVTVSFKLALPPTGTPVNCRLAGLTVTLPDWPPTFEATQTFVTPHANIKNNTRSMQRDLRSITEDLSISRIRVYGGGFVTGCTPARPIKLFGADGDAAKSVCLGYQKPHRSQ